MERVDRRQERRCLPATPLHAILGMANVVHEREFDEFASAALLQEIDIKNRDDIGIGDSEWHGKQ